MGLGIGDVITETNTLNGVRKARTWRVLHIGALSQHGGELGLNVWAQCLSEKRHTKGGLHIITTGLWLQQKELS